MDVIDYLARLVQGSTVFDPSAVRDVTLGQIQALYGKRRGESSGDRPGGVMSYEEVLRRTFKLRGLPDDQIDALIKQHLPAGKVKRASPRK